MSGGTNGCAGTTVFIFADCCGNRYYSAKGGTGGIYGGGGGSAAACSSGSSGGGGAVRIIWPGCARTFPSTDVGSP
jgi:hypothetical protein